MEQYAEKVVALDGIEFTVYIYRNGTNIARTGYKARYIDRTPGDADRWILDYLELDDLDVVKKRGTSN